MSSSAAIAVAPVASYEEISVGPNPGPQTEYVRSSADITIYGGSAGPGKALALDTPIATPSGWKTMGTLSVGDDVFAPDGTPTRVTWCSDVQHGRECFDVEFSDGAVIVADADHLWWTFTLAERTRLGRCADGARARRRAKRPSRATKPETHHSQVIAACNAQRAYALKAPPTGSVRTTREIAASLVARKTHRNHSVPVAEPLSLPSCALPLDPYVLGLWLGDGTTRDGSFSVGANDEVEIMGELVRAGFVPKRGLMLVLREMGLLNNKHIPPAYLRASLAQRLALAQGLMDADGHACSDGMVEFTTTLPALRDGVSELLHTLGCKARSAASRATLNGVDIGPKWRMLVMSALPLFRLTRKLNAQKRDGFRGTHGHRYIVAVRARASVPVRCIRVAHPSHCFLAGVDMVPTHNSWATLFRMGVHADQYAGYYGVVFRRDSTQITGGGGLWEESMKLFPMWGARGRGGGVLDWRWPNRSLIEMRHLQHAGDELGHHGKQYAECAALGTPVLMADGSWRPIESVQVGMQVQTMEGPRVVTRSRATGQKAMVRIRTPFGQAVVSAQHRVLTCRSWASPLEARATQCRSADSTPESCAQTRSADAPQRACLSCRRARAAEGAPRALRNQTAQAVADCGCQAGDLSAQTPMRLHAAGSTPARFESSRQAGDTPLACRCAGSSRTDAHAARTPSESRRQGRGAVAAGAQTDCAASCDARQAEQQLQPWYFHAELYVPPARRVASGADAHGAACAALASAARGCFCDCRICSGSYDARAHAEEECARAPFPSPADAAARDRGLHAGDCESAQPRSPRGSRTYRHPYTMQERPRRAVCRPFLVEACPAGEAETWDLTVADASHYIVSGGLVSQNCAFDELTTFLDQQFWYLLSRLRSNCGFRPKIIATCNPDPDSWVREFLDWWIGEDGIALPSRAGVKRYFIRDGDELVWGSSTEECRALAPHVVMRPMSVRFIPARLSDNPKGDPTYAERLKALPLVERERLAGANWNIRHAAGTVFKRVWYEVIEHVPSDLIAIGRYWDLAATEPHAGNRDPDWTRGVKMSRHRSGLVVIHDVVSLRGRPAAVDALVLATARQDGRGCTQGFWQDPGQAGKSEVDRYRVMLAGHVVKIVRAAENKLTYAKATSSLAEIGLVKLLRGPWNQSYLSEHEAFPDGPHDDIVDGESLGTLDLTAGVPTKALNIVGL